MTIKKAVIFLENVDDDVPGRFVQWVQNTASFAREVSGEGAFDYPYPVVKFLCDSVCELKGLEAPTLEAV